MPCSLIVMRNAQARQPSGLDEQNIFTITTRLVSGGGEAQQTQNLGLTELDLQAVRTTPGVIDAYVAESLPLVGRYETSPIARTLAEVEDNRGVPLATSFKVDEHALLTLGLRLTAGRWFYPKEVVKTFARPDLLPQIIITQALADKLFPQGGALGSVVIQSTTGSPGPSTIIGIVETLRIPGDVKAAATGPNSYLVPWLRPAGGGTYVVRVRPGRMAAAMRETEQRLRTVNPLRVISDIEPYTQTRWEAFRLSRSTVMILTIVCTLLLVITGCGIVGLTSYWIAQRRHHIGMRRALGARRGHILAYYLIENLLIAGLGTAIGVGLAMAVNLWLMKTFAVQHLDWGYVIGGAICVLAIGQLASFWPAFRAAAIPPALAARAR